ncbi:hypothetical protein HAX54_041611 [Datura stramonium]|uniref:Uncharacterized protein n=1 Tax=Datura stramonium TaxID=4076 RepID=A0ABS8SLN0_DATST|nr:hypothetical protein [Datura stramonium]
MFGMLELQLKICGRPTTDEEILALEERYPFIESAMPMCRVGPAFEESLDDDEATVLTDGVDDIDDDATTGAIQVEASSGDDLNTDDALLLVM